jgi:hypothetical protein
MMETKKLRQADFITSIILAVFGIWVLAQSLKMPMTGTYGGVRSVWYISPALLPLIVGGGIVLLSLVLLVHSIRSGGAADCIVTIRNASLGISEANERFLAILLALFSVIFLLLPRVDFVLSIVLFLIYFVPAFYYDTPGDLRRLSAAYGSVVALLSVVFMTGIATSLNSIYMFATDILTLLCIVALGVFGRFLAGKDPVRIRQFRVSLIVAIVTPLVLTPVFRFLLFVRLPREGGIVQLMQIIWYSLR